MKNKVHLVVSCDYAGTKDCFGDYFPENSFVAFAVSASGCDNLVCVLDHIGGLVSANVCSSRREAEEIARAWNETYKKNGTYFYNREMIPAKEAFA